MQRTRNPSNPFIAGAQVQILYSPLYPWQEKAFAHVAGAFFSHFFDHGILFDAIALSWLLAVSYLTVRHSTGKVDEVMKRTNSEDD